MITFVLHPGYVESKNDKQLHYIGSKELERLYQINRFKSKRVYIYDYRRECTMLGFRDQPEFVHLRPDYTGRYKMPKNCPPPDTP